MDDSIPPYAPYERPAAAIMHNGGTDPDLGSTPAQASESRMHKRRRLDFRDDLQAAGGPGSIENPNDQWPAVPHTQPAGAQAYPPAHHVSPPSYGQSAGAYADRSLPPPASQQHPASLTHEEGAPHWPAVVDSGSHASSYPDLNPYQQQPYFYEGQSEQPPTYDNHGSNGHHSNSSASWQGPETHHQQQYPEADVNSAYAAREHSDTAGMPYFPPPTSTLVEPTEPAEPTTSYYPPEVELTSQSYPYPQAVTTQAQHRDVVHRPSPYYYASDDASMNMKIQSLPILDNLATQLIHTLSKASYQQVKELMNGSDAEESQAYATLKSLFDQTRKVYSRDTPFIDAIAIQMFQPMQQEIIRKANIATFISSILGAFDVTFYHLNEFFMETFVPLGHRLLKWQGAIYLEMKTQTYISSLLNSQGSPGDLLDELFPPDLDAQILTRHPDAPSLSPSEQDFIDRSRARKSYLLAEPASAAAARELQKKYAWADFSREFASCIAKNVDGIMNVPARAQAGLGKNAGGDATPSAAASATKGSISGGAGPGMSSTKVDGTPGAERGKTATASSASAAGQASSTIRQPWTKTEEDALLSGLERVNGPHWSQILALYGRGGSQSEVLKDRNQVQLKDKARNLKLWYLKTGKEVPASLRGVTGELRKRGGARARAAILGEEGGDGLEDAEARNGAASGGARKKARK